MGIQVYSEEQILVNIPKTKDKTGSLWVSVNGVDIEIPRGIDVLIDRKYAEVIERCLKLEEKETQTGDELKAKERERIGAAGAEEMRKLSENIEGLSVFVTPQMFGAKADGVTDDTKAIQEAFNTAEFIYFPPGRYKVTSQLTVARPCKISMYKPYPCTYQGDYPLTTDDNYMGARIETYATDGYGLLIGDGVEIDGLYMRAMDTFEGVLFKFDGTLGHATYPSRVRLAHIILDNNSIYTVPESMFDFVPNETYFHVLDDITIGSLRGRQFCEYGFRTVMTTTDENWANSVRIRNLCIDILADYPLYIEGGAKGAENWVFENPSIQTYPYDVSDETYIGKSGHIDIVTLKNMQNPLILGGDIYDLHAASYGRIFNIVNTPNISCYGSNKFDEIDTNLTGKLQKASDNLNIYMLEMSILRDETTGDSTLVLSDGTRKKSILLPSATMTDEQINNGVGKWLDENSEPVVTIGKNKFNVLDSNTVNGEYYFLNGNLVFESNSSITTTNFIEAEENDKITVSLNGNKVGFYAIIYYDKDKNPLERVSTQSDGAISHTVVNTETAFVRLLFTQGTLVYANRESTNIMVLVNNETSLSYEAYNETIEDGTFTKIVEKSVSDYFAENSINNIIENKAEKSEVAIYVTPEMFGAVGDGVTDDSVALQKAIDEAGNTYPVYLSKKNYKISTGLIIHANYSNFKCDGTLSYDGTDSAITLTNTLRSVVEINAIYADNGTAIRLSNTEGRVTFNQISVNNIRSSKVGIHLTTPNTENLEPIYYNKISYMDIVATETGVLVESEGYYINENRYYGGTIGGGCNYGIKLVSGTYETSTNKFLSGGIEGIADEGRGIYIENSSNNIFRNIRTLEYYGKYILTFKGLSKRNDIEIPTVNLAEVDISELGAIGNDNNVIKVITSSLDGSTNVGNRIEVNGNYGFVYDTKKSITANNHIKLSLTNFPDFTIKPINNRIYTSFQSTVNSLNGSTVTLGEIYYGIGSMIKGVPIVFSFGDGTGRIKLVDVNGNTIFDATDGKFDNKTISVQWDGYDSYNSKHIWLVNVAGETNMDGSDGYTPIKGTDYFTEEDIQTIVNAVYAKIANGNEVAY